MRFLKYTLATITGIILTFGLFFFLLIGGIASLINAEEVIEVPSSSILKLKFNQQIQEKAMEDPFEGLDLPIATTTVAMSLKDILAAIQNAKDDDRVEGIYLELSAVPTGFAILHEIRQALISFKESGKPIFAYGEYYSEGAYYLASTADHIYLNPLGQLEFNGLSTETMYFKNLFEKFGIQPHIFRVGQYKSAVEPFLLDQMSEENEAQTMSYLNSIYDFYLENVSSTTGIDVKRLEEVSDKMLVRNAQDAVEFGLVHASLYYDQVEEALKEEFSVSEEDDLNFISYSKYRQATKNDNFKRSKNKIAVLFAEGTIVSGKGEIDQIGSEKIVKQLRKLREDDKVKAVVLRINSPGGSALASDVMWREINLTKAQKPVIASMSSVAASGGYYMAMACDSIVALPNTITGSIGIFSVFFQMDQLLSENLGLTFDEVGTGELSNFASATNEFTDIEKQILQSSVERGYEIFTSKAAEGRSMSVEDLKSVASGRVWSGEEAIENGLVDVLGGFDDAIQMAAEAAEVSDDFQVLYYQESESIWDDILESTQVQVKNQLLKSELGEFYPMMKKIQELKTLEGTQARMPLGLKVEL